MKRHGLAQIDLIVMVLVLLAMVTFTLAAVGSLDNADSRTRCATNLRQIGQAILLYSNDNKGSYPRTNYDMQSADKPTAFSGADAADPFGAGGPNANDVSAGLYLLMRTEDINSSAFVCPATAKQAMNFGGGTHNALDKANFPSADSLGYSYANPYPSEAALGKGYKLSQGLDPSFVVAADSNPGSDALTILTVNMSNSQVVRAGNSLNHSGDGQNVLYGDGHIEFQNSPLCGSHRDNIYTYGDSGVDPDTNVARSTGGIGVMGSPVGPGDSVLLPISNVVVTAAAPDSGASSSGTANSVPPAQASTGGGKMTIAIVILVLVAGVSLIAVLMAKKKKGETAGS